MKNAVKFSVLMAALAMIMTGCPFGDDPDDPSDPQDSKKTKTVSVGAQSGTITAGTAGTVTFAVTTANIANSSFNVTVSNLPTGVTVQGNVTISKNSGTLTLTIDGTTSESFTMNIAPAPKSVAVGAQTGTLASGTTDRVTFAVTTANITNGPFNVTVANLPTGVTVQGQVTINNNSGTLTLAGSATSKAGSYTNLTLTIDGTTSGAFTLTIVPGPIVLTSPIRENTTLKDQGLPVDYICNDFLVVDNNATLTIDPGVTIRFANTRHEGYLRIMLGATLKAMGSAEKHIQMIGSGDDKGAWRGIIIDSQTANELRYVDVLNGGSQNYNTSAAILLDNGRASFSHCLIDGSSSNGITVQGASGNYKGEFTRFSDNTVSNCNKAPVLSAGWMQCYGLRNIDNTNTFTGNTDEYIHINEAVNAHILADMTLHGLKGYPWFFQHGLHIDNDRNFTIEAGAVLLMGSSSTIYVPFDSHLIAEGTSSAHITIKGRQDVPGFWNNIRIRSMTQGSRFNYCDISGGGGGSGDNRGLLYSFSSYSGHSYFKIDNTTFSRSQNYGMFLEDNNKNNHVCVQSTNPASVTFSGCADGNLWSNCSGTARVYTNLSSACVLR